MLAQGIEQIACEPAVFPGAHVINLVGYPLAEGYPEQPMQRHLIEYFAEEMGVPPAWDDFHLMAPERPLDDAYVTIQTRTGWSPYKNWRDDRWAKLVQLLNKRGFKVVHLRGPTDPSVPGVYREVLSGLQGCLAHLAHASLHVGLDSWANHATNIIWNHHKASGYRKGLFRTPGVILWGSTQPTAAGYPHNQNIWKQLPCSPCFREDPKISNASRGVCPNPGGQTYDSLKNECMETMSVHDVDSVIQRLYEKGLTR